MAENSQLIRCSRCLLPSCYPTISYDEAGKCSFCEKWDGKWGNLDFEKESESLDSIFASVRGKTKPYDCVTGLSGGKDSCYTAYFLKKKGLSPLTVTFDNGFLSETARANIKRIVESLSLPHIFVKPEWPMLQKWYRHFFLTSGEFCSVCNLGIRTALYRAAKSYGIKIIVTGTSPRTEANSPKEFFTVSDAYFKNVAKKAFPKKEVKGFQYISQTKRIMWYVTKSVFHLCLPSYIPWNEEEMLAELKEEFGWSGILWEQHADCLMNDVKDYVKLKKFGVSEEAAKLSSLIRDGQITRERGLEMIQDYESKLMAEEGELQEKMRTNFDISQEQLEKGLKLTHTQFIPGTYEIYVKLRGRFYR